MGELYRLTFPSGKSYIGVTRATAEKRFKEHRRNAKRSHKGIIYNAWRKYGPPSLQVLAVLSVGDLYVTEKRAVSSYGTQHPNGYNLTPGGDVPPSLTPQVADKIRRALTGRKLSPERCQRIREIVTGRRHTAEAIIKMGKSQQRRWANGGTVSEGTREKMAAAKRGVKRTIKVRAKMSASQQARRKAEGCVAQRWRYPGVEE